MDKSLPAHHIEAITVNHNTSSYMELMLRSLFVRHTAPLNLSLIIYDNASQDDMTGLSAYAAGVGIPIIQSGFATQTKNNSHGEILSKLVFDKPDCTHYLFLDADVCFLEDNTLQTMLVELENAPGAFGIGPLMSWDGVQEIPMIHREANPDICDARLHPCCALIKNTPVFRSVVKEVGLSKVNYLWAEEDEYIDTFKLMTRVMKTHGMRKILSSKMVLHFFCVSYIYEPTEHWRAGKEKKRDELLAELLALDSA